MVDLLLGLPLLFGHSLLFARRHLRLRAGAGGAGLQGKHFLADFFSQFVQTPIRTRGGEVGKSDRKSTRLNSSHT